MHDKFVNHFISLLRKYHMFVFRNDIKFKYNYYQGILMKLNLTVIHFTQF
jgi:hypothetical protein